MEAVGFIIAMIGLVAFGVALVALVRGRMGWARIASRKAAAAALVGAFGVMAVGNAIMPTAEPEGRLAVQAGETATTTTTIPSTTTTDPAPSTSSTSAPTSSSSTTSTSEATTTTIAPAPTTTTTTVAVKTACGAPDQAPGIGTAARIGVVPNVKCMDLQLAQDKSQAAGFYDLGSEDMTGQARNQVVDRDWVVVSQSPAAGTKADAGTRLVFTVLGYGGPGAPAIPDRSQPGRLPKLACFDLQEAQDTLQSAGFAVMTSEDGTGQGRSQLVDRNWTVTAQTPSPGGTHAKSTPVILKAVKDGEPSSCS